MERTVISFLGFRRKGARMVMFKERLIFLIVGEMKCGSTTTKKKVDFHLFEDGKSYGNWGTAVRLSNGILLITKSPDRIPELVEVIKEKW